MPIVLGGGLGGLSAAYYLIKHSNSLHAPKLFEASNRFGGWIKTDISSADSRVRFEVGTRTIRPKGFEGFNTLALCSELGLSNDILPIPSTHVAAKNRLLAVNGGLTLLPSSITGMFKTIPPFSKPLISALIHDLNHSYVGEPMADDTIYNFTERRFGTEVAKYLISPMICGISAGDAKEISVKFLLKELFEWEQTYTSVSKGIYNKTLKRLMKKDQNKAPDPTVDCQLAKRSLTERWSVYSMNGGLEKLTPLTGIPQIDYICDPNLPRELNGYNLSTYPFLNSVPDNDDIDFKCDGLHDGFYASIKYSCQLYHHCVYGIRHDFLCANFTAFDQKSFICHFVSEVNCKASPKYWFRNDALYKATTTTTTIAPPPTTSQAPERPLRRPGRPLRRRRPQHEYFYDDEDYDDDYVEERMNRRRKTNRNRNRRPEYDDEYDNPPPRTNYKEDDDYSEFDRPAYRHRNRNRETDDDFEYDRRSYRNRKRSIENKRHHDDDDVEIEDRPHSDGRKSVENGKRKKNDRRTPVNDDKGTLDDRRSLGEDDRYDRRKLNDERRPIDDDDDRRSSVDESRRPNHEKRRPSTDARRPQYDDDEYDDYVIEKSKKHGVRDDDYDERVFSKRPKSSHPEIIPKVRSSSATASIFNRPRAPLKINRPVPNNEKKKYKSSQYRTTAIPNPINSRQAPQIAAQHQQPQQNQQHQQQQQQRQPQPSQQQSQYYDDEYDY